MGWTGPGSASPTRAFTRALPASSCSQSLRRGARVPRLHPKLHFYRGACRGISVRASASTFASMSPTLSDRIRVDAERVRRRDHADGFPVW